MPALPDHGAPGLPPAPGACATPPISIDAIVDGAAPPHPAKLMTVLTLFHRPAAGG